MDDLSGLVDVRVSSYWLFPSMSFIFSIGVLFLSPLPRR